MTLDRCTRTILPLTTVLLVVISTDAEAYVDPGTGSMLAQLLLGGLMAAIVMVRTWWQRIRRWTGGTSASDEE
jgi:hypothetical protein